MITGTYNLLADPSWSLLQLNEVRLECDTTTGPVTINLPAISTLAQSTNLKLVIVDATANASSNNITINAGISGTPPISDTFDDSSNNQIVLNTDGSSVVFQNLTSTQWLAVESVAAGGGGSSNPFTTLLSTEPLTFNITDALEGTSIPDGSTDSYIKTIPLTGMLSTINTALIVFNTYEIASGPASRATVGNGYGVTSGGMYPTAAPGTGYPMVETMTRLLVTSDYTKALRPQPIANLSGLKEVDENNVELNSGTNLNYSQIGGCLIGAYQGSFQAIGYTSDLFSSIQDNTVIKSAYLDNSGPVPNLVFLLKKRKATSSFAWLTLEFNVYNLSI